MIITELLPDAGANGIATFEAKLVNTNDTSIAVLTYDPLDVAHSEGVLYKGELEAFEAERGFLLEYHLTTEDEREPLADRSIQIGDLDSPGFNVAALVSFFTPDLNDPPKDIYTLPVQGGELVVETKITQIDPLDTWKEFEHLLDVTPGSVFLRGDCNDDGTVDLSDPVCALNWLFGGAATPACIAALNTNGDDDVNIADPVSLLNYLFAGGLAPAVPFPDCGPGMLPADQEIGCANPPDCQ